MRPTKRPAEDMASTSSSSSNGFVRCSALGSGSYGHVSLALDKTTGKPFAVKSVHLDPESRASLTNLRALENEIQILSRLDSPYIVRCLGDSWSTDGPSGRTRNLHLELAPGGSLAGLIRSSGALGLPLVRKYTRDVVLALTYLHERGIAHRDVKCLNLLLGTTCAKLADFGTATQCAELGEEVAEQTKLEGSPLWMSPEAVKGQGSWRLEADIWSLGCTVLEMATGKAPWSEDDRGLYGALHSLGCTNSIPRVPDTLPRSLRAFILSCLRREPQDRPKAVDLLEHPFLAEAKPGQDLEPALADEAMALPSREQQVLLQHTQGLCANAAATEASGAASASTTSTATAESLLSPVSVLGCLWAASGAETSGAKVERTSGIPPVDPQSIVEGATRLDTSLNKRSKSNVDALNYIETKRLKRRLLTEHPVLCGTSGYATTAVALSAQERRPMVMDALVTSPTRDVARVDSEFPIFQWAPDVSSQLCPQDSLSVANSPLSLAASGRKWIVVHCAITQR